MIWNAARDFIQCKEPSIRLLMQGWSQYNQENNATLPESKHLLLLEVTMKISKPFEDDICILRGKYNTPAQLLHEVLPSREVNLSVWQWSFPQMSSENYLFMITIYNTKIRNPRYFITRNIPRDLVRTTHWTLESHLILHFARVIKVQYLRTKARHFQANPWWE